MPDAMPDAMTSPPAVDDAAIDRRSGLGSIDPVEHPRPLLRRPTWRSLDGVWDFHRGVGRGERPPEAYPDRIVVPFAPESPASGIGDRDLHATLWYRRTVEVPPEWAGQRWLLHLSGIDGAVEVWLDGARVASAERAFAPVAFDLTAVRPERAVALEIRTTRDPLDLGAPRGKQDWLLEAHSIWYPRSSGVTRTVWMEAVPAAHVAELRADADLADFALDVVVGLAGVPHGTAARDGWRLAVAVRRGTELLADERWTVSGPDVRRRLHLPDPGIDDARDRLLWRPESPTLLDLEVALERDGVVLDRTHGTAAMRTVGVDGDAFLLNGRPYPLRLVLDQGYWPDGHRTAPDGEALRRDVELTKRLGFNGVRKHQTLEDPRYYAWADRLGLLVWSELPSAYAFGPRTVARLADDWRRQVERDRGHPSVIVWVAFNESWGVPDLPVRTEQRQAVRALYHLAKALDPTRPVIGNDGWEWVVGDLRTVHDYAADPALLADRYGDDDALARTLTGFRPGGRALVLDPALEAVAAPSGPVVLSEFGGVRAQMDGDGWGYAAVEDGAALLERYRALLAAVQPGRSALAGFCYTQLTDTFQEQNGLLTMDRRPKADLDALAAATRGEGGPAA